MSPRGGWRRGGKGRCVRRYPICVEEPGRERLGRRVERRAHDFAHRMAKSRSRPHPLRDHAHRHRILHDIDGHSARNAAEFRPYDLDRRRSRGRRSLDHGGRRAQRRSRDAPAGAAALSGDVGRGGRGGRALYAPFRLFEAPRRRAADRHRHRHRSGCDDGPALRDGRRVERARRAAGAGRRRDRSPLRRQARHSHAGRDGRDQQPQNSRGRLHGRHKDLHPGALCVHVARQGAILLLRAGQ